MSTFIDDQGGTGWKPGAHTHFRLTAVWLPTQDVEAFKASIRAVRRKLNISSNHEFKFSETHYRPDWRTAFFDAALRSDFRFVTCAYDKNRCQPGSIEPYEFHWGCATTLAAYLKPTYLQAESQKCQSEGKPALLLERVLVDDNQDGDFLKVVEAQFRALASGWKPGGKLVNKVRFFDSARDEPIQLADMVMGAVGAHIDGDSTWYNLISARTLGVIRLPE